MVQRGNRRQETFFCDQDFAAYLELLTAGRDRSGTQIWAYCLMPNHVHLIVVPKDIDGLRSLLGPTHLTYTRRINRRFDWRGHLWQERFFSAPMDEAYLLACVRYVELNPVRAGLAVRPEDWRWSSAAAHLARRTGGLLATDTLYDLVPDWLELLEQVPDRQTLETLRSKTGSGRPLGNEGFVTQIETRLGRNLLARSEERSMRGARKGKR